MLTLSRVLAVAWCVLMLSLAGCGGGGGHGGGTTGGMNPGIGTGNPANPGGMSPSAGSVDTRAPTASILFPPTASVTESNRITVRGTANDDGTIAMVRVNGIAATSPDGFASWQAVVPLIHGRQMLTVDVIDSAANRNASAAQVAINSTGILLEPARIAVDAANNRALVVDTDGKSIVSVDLASGARTVLSNAINPNRANVLANPGDIAVDSAGNRALVIDIDPNGVATLVAVNLSTGERSVVSDGHDAASGVEFVRPAGIAVDAKRNRAIVSGRNNGTLIAVDLTTGMRTQLIDNFLLPQAIVIDAAKDRALLFDFLNTALVAVDLATGARTTISGQSTQSVDTPFESVFGLALDVAGHRALVLQNGSSASNDPLPSILGVDLTTGVRTIVANATTPDTNQTLRFPSAIAVDQTNGRLLVTDGGGGVIVAASLVTGARTLLADTTAPIPANPFRDQTGGIVLDSAHGRLLASDLTDAALVALDLSSGSYSVFARGNTQSDNPCRAAGGIVIDSANNRALINGTSAIDLADGSCTQFADTGSSSIAIDLANNRVLSAPANSSSLIAVDLSSRVQSSIPAFFGSPPATFSNPAGLAFDSLAGRALVVDNIIVGTSMGIVNNPVIYAVSTTTRGSATIFSNATIPNSSNALRNPQAIALDGRRNRALVADADLDAIVGLSRVDGSRSIVSDRSTPNPLDFPTGIAVDDAKGIAFIADDARIRVIDLVTGERVVY